MLEAREVVIYSSFRLCTRKAKTPQKPKKLEELLSSWAASNPNKVFNGSIPDIKHTENTLQLLKNGTCTFQTVNTLISQSNDIDQVVAKLVVKFNSYSIVQ